MGAINPIRKKMIGKVIPFYVFCLASGLLAVILFFINFKLVAVPAIIFILVCITAPFITWAGFFVPVISRGHSGKRAVALTFDDGPDTNVTPAVLKILSGYSAKATFLVTGRNAVENPDIIKEILKQGHSIGNHSYNHDPLLMLRTRRRLYNEIKSTQEALKEFGIISRVFRPPAGITNPKLRGILMELDLLCVNWSTRAFDAGNRRVNCLSGKIMKKVKPDDIILLHDINTLRDNMPDFLTELEMLLEGLLNSGMKIVPLSELIGIDVMRIVPSVRANGPFAPAVNNT